MKNTQQQLSQYSCRFHYMRVNCIITNYEIIRHDKFCTLVLFVLEAWQCTEHGDGREICIHAQILSSDFFNTIRFDFGSQTSSLWNERKTHNEYFTYHMLRMSGVRIRDEIVSMKSWIRQRDPSDGCQMRGWLHPRQAPQNWHVISWWHANVSPKKEISKSSLWCRHPLLSTSTIPVTSTFTGSVHIPVL